MIKLQLIIFPFDESKQKNAKHHNLGDSLWDELNSFRFFIP